MTVGARLKEVIENSGMKISALCDKIGTTRTTFYKKLNGKIPFNVPEIEAITQELHLTAEQRDKIFFEEKVAK